MDLVIGWSVRISEIVFIVDLIILLPMSFFKKTKVIAGNGIFFSSYIFGITVWFLGAIITFYYWGIIALIIGLILMGVGVVPMAMLACIFNSLWLELGILIGGSVLVIIVRLFGGNLAEKAKSN
jgi:hypothetical protein